MFANLLFEFRKQDKLRIRGEVSLKFLLKSVMNTDAKSIGCQMETSLKWTCLEKHYSEHRKWEGQMLFSPLILPIVLSYPYVVSVKCN